MAEPGYDQPLKTYRTILEQEISQAEQELCRPTKGLLVSGLLAGFGVGVSVLLTAITLTVLEDTWAAPLAPFAMANAYTVGFIIVILGRTDLFTEYTTLAILPVLTGDSRLSALGRLWGLVYAANLVGTALFAALTAAIGPALGSITPEALDSLARDLLRHPWWIILLSATLAGWLMGILSWLVTAGRDTTSQVLFVWLITFSLALAHLHHSITGAGEILAAIFAHGALTLSDFGYFLFWTTLGNGLGGVIFAVLIRYSLVIRETNEPETNGPEMDSRSRSRRPRGSGGSRPRGGSD